MEKQSERQNLALPVSGLLLLSVTVGGLMLFDVPLKSERPAQSKKFVRGTFEDETVRARLWQDPFGPVYDEPSRGADACLPKPDDLQKIASKIRCRAMGSSDLDSRVKETAEENVVLMAAMVPGSGLSEDAEMRRRTRQALVSALAVKGYVASSGERIGYLDTHWEIEGRLQSHNDASGISVRIPFEWFERDLIRPDEQCSESKWLLVIWLDEEAFRKHTMRKLNELLGSLLSVRGSPLECEPERDPEARCEILDQVKLCLIGPTSSSTLLSLLEPSDPNETRKQTCDSTSATPYVLGDLDIYSPRATAPEALLVRQRNLGLPPKHHVVAKKDSDQKIEDILREVYQVNFVSTVVRDDDSAKAIVEELQRRGVDLNGNTHHVALIGEWDTFFGRALPIAIEAAIQHQRGEESAGWSPAGTLQLMLKGDVKSPPRVHRFSYMRGLDGSTPLSDARDRTQQNADGDKSDTPWEIGVSEWERPVGASGLDYIRRVAEKLSQLDRSLMARGERLKAIGVVGSDVYDKLLVLQALRARFPGVIFFTTDLDARLLHPSRYPWCRNLVVASGYGLELTRDLQREIPPFRDSYQTSTYFACLLALGGVDTEEIQILPKPLDAGDRPAAVDPSRKATGSAPDQVTIKTTYRRSDLAPLLQPRLFEVARSGAYDITPREYKSLLHPEHTDGRPSPRMFAKLFLLSVIAGLLFLPLNRNFRRFFIDRTKIKPRDRESFNYFTLLTFLSIAIFGVLIYLDGRDGTGEPFELFEGISIWPTEMCRLFIILLSWVLFILAIIGITVSNGKLEHDDMLLPNESRAVEPSFWERWKRVRDRRMRLWRNRSRPVPQLMFMRPLRHCIVEWRLFWRARREISINAWFQEQQVRHAAEMNEPVEIGPLWNRYRELGRVGNRLWRFLPLVFVYLAYGWCLTLIFGKPHVPYRGSISGATDQVLMILSSLALVALTFFVVDATRLCERFIRIVAQRPTSWPATALIRKIVNDRGVTLEDVSDYINVQVIARRTEVVGKLISYPFIVLFVALISSNGYFDNWSWPLQTLLFLGVILAYAVICAIVLRRAAEGARSKSLGRLRRKLSKAHGSNAKNKDARVAQFELMIQEIESIRRGAFAPWSRHPIVSAVLIPFGGVGTVALLDVLSKMGG